MTALRKRFFDLCRLLLLDCAADQAIPPGTRERLSMMAARLDVELEAIGGVEEATFKAMPDQAPASATVEAAYKPQFFEPKKPRVKALVCGQFSYHRWEGGKLCRRCGATQ